MKGVPLKMKRLTTGERLKRILINLGLSKEETIGDKISRQLRGKGKKSKRRTKGTIDVMTEGVNEYFQQLGRGKKTSLLNTKRRTKAKRRNNLSNLLNSTTSKRK